ncbi:MAG TPA: hypothetical protein DD001_13325 [Microcoleaceae bacterium UBA10368]|jgi:hypothetical protein|nr:hypothetical protein [Microcoleaceae cyanobacterium UBA10368]HCV32672.1 hypothetical protein [Microcoleaceae cyanobacterium UBA9251]
MNTSRKIQIALGTIFLWSSTSISSFAATNSITSEKFQSDSVKLPVESIPSKQLNSTQDTYLIAQSSTQIYDMLNRADSSRDKYFPKFEDALTKPDSKKILLEFCPSQPQDKVDNCWRMLNNWAMTKEMMALDSSNYALVDKMRDISMAVIDIRRNKR